VHIARPQLGRQAVAFAIKQQQQGIAGGLEVSVVGALLLLSVHGDLRRIHVQDGPVT
jgi:hypothetical protein